MKTYEIHESIWKPFLFGPPPTAIQDDDLPQPERPEPQEEWGKPKNRINRYNMI